MNRRWILPASVLLLAATNGLQMRTNSILLGKLRQTNAALTELLAADQRLKVADQRLQAAAAELEAADQRLRDDYRKAQAACGSRK